MQVYEYSKANIKASLKVQTKIYLSIDWKNCLVGQSYDGVQNMRMQFQGLKVYVQQKFQSAIFFSIMHIGKYLTYFL